MNAFDRNTNLEIIRQLRNSEKMSLDNFIGKILIPLKDDNPTFLKVLYMDICYILKGLDHDTDNDLLIEGGDFVFEEGDIKLTGYQTRLHDITVWLHSELILEAVGKTDNPKDFLRELGKFEEEIGKKNNYTPEYKSELQKVKRSIIKEKRDNYSNDDEGLKKYLDFEVLELKPNLFGIGINFNEIINRWNRK